jgi:hypothetical protein
MTYMCDSWLDQSMSFEESRTQAPNVNCSESLLFSTASRLHLGEPEFDRESHDTVAGSRGETGNKIIELTQEGAERYGTRHGASGALNCRVVFIV